MAVRHWRGIALAVIALLLVTCPGFAAEPGSAAALQALLKAGRFEQAYREAKTHELERAGDPQFDYLLGLAALQSGRPGEASLALERVVAVSPDFAGAELDLARARFELGQLSEARETLEGLKARRPPPDAARAIDE